MAAKLSVVVCTHNGADRLAETLRALRAQDADPADFETVVVNNACTDGTSAVVAAASVREVLEPIPGQVHARVRGVRETAGEWIAFVDDDNLLAPDWVGAALAFAVAHPDCGAFGGTVELQFEIPPPPAVARCAYAYAATEFPGGAQRLDGDDRWRLRGAGLVCRRQALLDAGWLSWQGNVGRAGAGTMAGDDSEIVMRIARAGWDVWYEPACRLRHVISRDRLTVGYLRSLHRGFALADPLLLGFQRRGSLARWAARYAVSLARRVYWLARHTFRGVRDADARLTAQLTLDTLRGNLRGLGAVARLDPTQRSIWLGRDAEERQKAEGRRQKAEGRAESARHRPQGDNAEGYGLSAIDYRLSDRGRKAEGGPAPLRVLHLHSGRDYGGLERTLACLGTDRAECPEMEPVFGLGHRHRLADELSAAGARVEILGPVSVRHPWQTLLALRRLRALLRRERFAAVVCHGSASLAFSGRGAADLGVPIVLWMHSDTKIRNKNLVERLAGGSRPRLVICNSAFTAASLPLLLAGPPPHTVIHCPVARPPAGSRDGARRAALRAEFATPAKAVVVILPSRLEEWKGHRVLLKALARLRHLPAWHCWIVGGPFDAVQERFLHSMVSLAEALEIGSRVFFSGQRADVPDLLAAADVFCQPNLTPEPFGVNVVEALYAGLPVVASDSGGTREIVDHTCGRLIEPGDVSAFAAELERLILDDGYRRALGGRARERAATVSSPANILPALHAQLARLAPPVPAVRTTAETPASPVAQRRVML